MRGTPGFITGTGLGVTDVEASVSVLFEAVEVLGWSSFGVAGGGIASSGIVLVLSFGLEWEGG